MKLEFESIIKFLEANHIAYQIYGEPHKTYQVASIFSPINQGFYFIESEFIATQIKNSLLLINNRTNINDQNTYLIIENSPQLVYYKILRDNFAEKSTGKISSTALIHRNADIGSNVQIDDYAIIGACKIDSNSIVKSHVTVNDNCKIGANTIIGEHCVVGANGTAWIWDDINSSRVHLPQLGGVIIENNCQIGAHGAIVRGSLNENTIISQYTVIAPGVRLGHGTILEDYCHLANGVITGGNTLIGHHCFVGSGAVFLPKVRLHEHSIVGAGAVVVKDTTGPGFTMRGNPAKEYQSKNEKPSGMPKPLK